MYNCVDITSLGSSVEALLGIRPGVNTVCEDRATVGLALGGTHVESLGNSYGVRGS